MTSSDPPGAKEVGSSSAPGRASQNPPGNAKAYWRANLTLIGVLLLIWATVSYGCGIFWVEWLNQYSMGKLPLGFWFAQQGSIYVFVVLVLIYAVAMDRLDRKYGVEE